jgi:hypothetical protein
MVEGLLERAPCGDMRPSEGLNLCRLPVAEGLPLIEVGTEITVFGALTATGAETATRRGALPPPVLPSSSISPLGGDRVSNTLGQDQCN